MEDLYSLIQIPTLYTGDMGERESMILSPHFTTHVDHDFIGKKVLPEPRTAYSRAANE